MAQYQNAQGDAGASPTSESSDKKDDDVIDADFTEKK